MFEGLSLKELEAEIKKELKGKWNIYPYIP